MLPIGGRGPSPGWWKLAAVDTARCQAAAWRLHRPLVLANSGQGSLFGDAPRPYGKNSEPTLLFCDVRSNFALVLEHPPDFLSITCGAQ